MPSHGKILADGGAWALFLMPVAVFAVIWGLPHLEAVLGWFFGLLRMVGELKG